jgi:hypothetical protein
MAAVCGGHDEVVEFLLGPTTHFETRERRLGHAALAARGGGWSWVADVLEAMSERER